MRTRWHLPTWGRFLSEDPIGYLGGPNLYAFVDSSPTRFRDPFGLTGRGQSQAETARNGVFDVVQRSGNQEGPETIYAVPPGTNPTNYDPSKLVVIRLPRTSAPFIKRLVIKDGKVDVVQGDNNIPLDKFVREGEGEDLQPTLIDVADVVTLGAGTVIKVAGGVGKVATRALTMADLGLGRASLRAIEGLVIDAGSTRIIQVANVAGHIPIGEIRAALPTLLDVAARQGVRTLQIETIFANEGLQKFVVGQATRLGGTLSSTGAVDTFTFILGK
jgi:hypothetical protein